MKRNFAKLFNENYNNLLNSKMRLEDIFDIMFSREDLLMAEYNDGFRMRSYTYGEVKKMAIEVSCAIYEMVGNKHEYIALEMENSVEWIAAFWGILRSGNMPYLINTRHTQKLSNSIIKTLKIKYVIAAKKGNLAAEYIEFYTLKTNNYFDGDFCNEIAISTSATSLNETICFYDGNAISHQILNSKKIVTENKRMALHYKGYVKQLAFLPFYHIFGLFAVYFWFGFFGRTFVFLRDYSPSTLLETCREHKVTHIFAVPLLWHTIEKQVLKEIEKKGEKKKTSFYRGIKLCTKLQNIFPYLGARLSRRIMHQVTNQLFGNSIQFCISGGSYINSSALELFNGIGYPLHNGYGMSEIGIASVELRDRPKNRNKNSIGVPFESIKYKISEGGTLLVSGKSTCSRILFNGESREVNGWLDTLDIVVQDDDGYYYIKGRQSDIVIAENGENINPDVIEQSFNPSDALAFSVLGFDSGNGEQLTMILQLNKYTAKSVVLDMLEEIKQINETLPVVMQLKNIYLTFDPIMPETAIKVGRRFLLRGIKEGSINLIPLSEYNLSDNSDDFDSNSPLAMRVREIIAQVINKSVDEIGANTHLLYDLGISSLEYFEIISVIADEFKITEYSDTQELSYTVKEICDFLEGNM